MRPIKIIYEGTDIYPDISVNSCYHDMYAEKQSDELLITMNDTRRLWDIWNPQQNDIISVEDGAARTGKMFVESVIPENGLVTLRAFSMPQTPKDKTNKSWEKVKFTQLAKEIAGRHGLGFEQYGIKDQLYAYVVQNNIPDFKFLQQRCVLEGAAFLIYDGKLVVYDEAYLEDQSPADAIEIDQHKDFEYRDDAVNGYGCAEIVNSDLTGTFVSSNGCTKKLRRVIPVQISSQGEANRFAKGLLRNANKNMTTGSLWLAITKQYAAASIANLQTVGHASWDGSIFITRVRHDYVRDFSKIFFRKPLEGY